MGRGVALLLSRREGEPGAALRAAVDRCHQQPGRLPHRSRALHRHLRGRGGAAGAATTAKGTTHGIAGDIALDRTHPEQSTLGEIVVNVEQLTSDNSLRDKRIRTEYLESHEHPLVKLTNAKLNGLPATIADGKSYPFTIDGDLTVHGTTKPVSWKANATLSGDTLTADATATVKMSEFGVGPISLIGLVKTGDDVTLHLSLTAPKDFQPPAELTSTKSDTTSASGPSFKKDVLPILQSNCAGCHNPGQLGQNDWKLDTARTRPRSPRVSSWSPRPSTCRRGRRPTRACRCSTPAG